MKPAWFPKVETIDWTRFWFVLGMASAFWGGMAGLTLLWPPFDFYYKAVNIALGAITAPILFAARGTKYVVNRMEPPADGNP